MGGMHRFPALLQPFGGGAVIVAATDPRTGGTLAFAFNQHGVLTTLAFDDGQLLHALDSHTYDLVVLDMGVAGARPAVVVSAVRQRTDASLLVLRDGVGALPPGVDANLVLPSGMPPVVIAAQGMVLTGFRPEWGVEITQRWGPLELDTARRRVRWHGREVTITPMQFRLLYALVLAGGAVVSKRDLHRLVWGSAVVDDGERITAHIKRIRAKLEEDPARPAFLLTVRGEGYRLADVEPLRRTGG